MRKPSRPYRPTPLQTAILRRAGAGGVLCTMVEGARHFSYEDGTPVSGSHEDVERCIRNGWLKGGDDALDPTAPSQVYRVPRARLSA
jgi:hypothetical protein